LPAKRLVGTLVVVNLLEGIEAPLLLQKIE